MRSVLGCCLAVVWVLLSGAGIWPTTAVADPVSGPHETIDLTATTTKPNTSTGLNYVAKYHAAGNPSGDPPALRKLVIIGPPGIRWDSSAAPECDATDEELRQQGEAACPQGSKIGSGEGSAKILGAAPITFELTPFNAPNSRFELVELPVGPAAVVRDDFQGRRTTARIPTCLDGGYVPEDCESDQIVLLSNEVHQEARSSNGRNLITTPPDCPDSGHWTTQVILHFADGSVDKLNTHQPCDGESAGSASPGAAPETVAGPDAVMQEPEDREADDGDSDGDGGLADDVQGKVEGILDS